ncbi:hypothetical protein HPP92_000235 [Vanilla planifolia]|uniref:Ubiquitin-specific protease family C19-related protein n=1 Tax=Vanilla planifolia TaxID=51239 RepID=A0A835SAB0_VANPL|nr:hypothetical protein HPP92_000235 [Vanilla planifolia]
MSGRRAHKLSTGMMVSGPPPPPAKDRFQRLSSAAAPYTGGDVRLSGELGRMFDIGIDRSTSVPISRSHSGPLTRPTATSVPATTRKSSGPILPPTGLITSGRIDRRSGELSSSTAKRKEVAPGVTVVDNDIRFWFLLPKLWLWVSAVVFLGAIGVGVFVWVEVGRLHFFVVFAGAAVGVGVMAIWNWTLGRRELERYFRAFPDSSINPRNLPVGKLVKVTGHVTCGNIPLDTSYQNVPRCIYTSTELHESRARKNLYGITYSSCTWSLKRSEKHVVDFYLSDVKSGTRFLVRAGNGAKVICFVKPTMTLLVSKKNKEQSPSFLRWLQNQHIASGDSTMRLNEGYIKEGSTMSILGTLKSHQNLVIIDPPEEVSSTGWQWRRCFIPMHVEGLILIGDETPEDELCHV